MGGVSKACRWGLGAFFRSAWIRFRSSREACCSKVCISAGGLPSDGLIPRMSAKSSWSRAGSVVESQFSPRLARAFPPGRLTIMFAGDRLATALLWVSMLTGVLETKRSLATEVVASWWKGRVHCNYTTTGEEREKRASPSAMRRPTKCKLP